MPTRPKRETGRRRRQDPTLPDISSKPQGRKASSIFAGLVAQAKQQDPIPSRTRPSNASAPMVLCLKARESRSPPGPPRSTIIHSPRYDTRQPLTGRRQGDAGWSSPVARQAHNLKAAGSNPAPATTHTPHNDAEPGRQGPVPNGTGRKRVRDRPARPAVRVGEYPRTRWITASGSRPHTSRRSVSAIRPGAPRPGPARWRPEGGDGKSSRPTRARPHRRSSRARPE